MIFDQETIKSVNNIFRLPYTGKEQDWPLEFADRNRIFEFISAYKSYHLNNKEKIAIFSLILYSYEEYLSYEKDIGDEIWENIVKILDEYKIIFDEIIIYWALWEETNNNNFFNITSVVRNYISDQLSQSMS